jgi:hypothetical protein
MQAHTKDREFKPNSTLYKCSLYVIMLAMCLNWHERTPKRGGNENQK